MWSSWKIQLVDQTLGGLSALYNPGHHVNLSNSLPGLAQSRAVVPKGGTIGQLLFKMEVLPYMAK